MVLVTTLGMVCPKRSATRSVKPLMSPSTRETPKFSRDMSTGLFVGVGEYQDETLTVQYAVDDAVDLAHRFTLDNRVGLVPPRRAVLVISGTPQKEESKQRLHDLDHAGVRIVRNATSGEILDLLKEQSARAGHEGIFVLSIASHGFQQNGDSYILGSTSSFGAPASSLRTATIFDIAALAGRSLIFMDACRDRIGKDSRGASDPAAVAPLISRMSRVQGQVIFYAAAPGEVAYDDDEHKNGVFTKAVLDGLDCKASAPGGVVRADTLHTFLNREVHNWIEKNKHRFVDPATQISLEGTTRNMPLSQCWRSPGPAIRAEIDRTIVTGYNDKTRMLWRKDFGTHVVGAIAADLDADAFYEVVVGLPDRVVAFDRDGHELWTKNNEAKTLTAFAVGDLFRKHTNQIVTLWNDGRGTRVTVFDSDGSELASRKFDEPFRRVAIGRPTNMHAPKIVVAAANSLMLLHPKKFDHGKPVWNRRLRNGDAIEELNVRDVDHDRREDIEVKTASSTTWFTFDGKLLRQKITAAAKRP